MRIAFRSAALALVFATLIGSARAQLKKSDSVVKVEAEAGKLADDGTQNVTVTVTIDKGWHLYANPVGNDDLAENQVVVTLSSKNKLKDVKVEYPAGKNHTEKGIGDYKIYEGKLTIKAKVTRNKGDSEPIDVAVKVQACDANTCLLPATVKLTAK
ncbi:MAG TPA: protein-disulfide reductase DsbD N-terminal domain-containing protein [Gemmataceae bacterium]|nr:protein-disulfide reductase DsbD N-terminal domain-containing protein [Gemmataceae bacterium]